MEPQKSQRSQEVIEQLRDTLELGLHPVYSMVERELGTLAGRCTITELEQIREIALDCTLLPAPPVAFGNYEAGYAKDFAVSMHRLLREQEQTSGKRVQQMPSQSSDATFKAMADWLREGAETRIQPVYSRIEKWLETDGSSCNKVELKLIRDLALDCSILPELGLLGSYESNAAREVAFLAHRLLRNRERRPGTDIDLRSGSLPPTNSD